MNGYKAFNADLTCRDFQYEIGGEYTMKGRIHPCERGFHFCETLKQTMCFYSFDPRTRWCEVEATDVIIPSDIFRKYVTNHIKILREIPWETVAEMIDIANEFVLVHTLDNGKVEYRRLPEFFCLVWERSYETVSENIGKIHVEGSNLDIYFGLSADGTPVSCPKEFAWNFIKEHTEGK